MKTRALSILLALALLAAPSAAQKEKRPMGDIPDHVGMWLYLRAFVDVPGDESEIDLPADAGYVKIGYNPVTNRIKIFEASGDRRELPTFGTEYADIFLDSIVLVNHEGNFDTTLNEASGNPLFSFFTPTPEAVRWMPDEGRIGDGIWVKSLVNETARDGVTAVTRKVLRHSAIDTCVAEAVSINLNSASVQHLYFNDTGRRFVPTRLVVRDPSIDLAAYSQTVTAGSNASADDAFAPQAWSALSGAGSYLISYPKAGARMVADSDYLDLVISSAFAAGTIKVDVWGHFQD